jgi:hypothetical protein
MIYRADISSVAVGMFLLFTSINSEIPKQRREQHKAGDGRIRSKIPNLLGSLAAKAQYFFLLERPNSFAICNNTLSKWWEG